jgi:hypothetical protein
MINMNFFQKFYFEFPRIFIYRGSCSINFFWKILSMGLSPLLDPKNPYIRGDTGGGRGYPYRIGGYMGGVDYYIRGSGGNIIKKGNYCPPSSVTTSSVGSSGTS